MLSWLRSFLYPVQRELDELKMLQASAHFRQANLDYTAADIHAHEYKVFSQFGDDGIIQFLISRIETVDKVFIEFGVEDFLESNCRFLMMHDNWSGLIFDGSSRSIGRVRSRDDYWKYDLEARCAFLSRENLNAELKQGLGERKADLISIDVDGNDYWLLDALELRPSILIVEYNSVFGPDRAITVPYRADFDRSEAHFSNLYFGASLLALTDLAMDKGYSLLGSNTAGNNAYFLRNDVLQDAGMQAVPAESAYVCSRFRESRDSNGTLSYASGAQRLEIIRGMPVYNTRTSEVEPL